MAAPSSALSSSKLPPGLKHYLPPLSGLALILVLLLAEEVHLALADGNDPKRFNSALRARVSELLKENELQTGESDKNADTTTSQEVSSRKAESILDITTSSATNRQLMDIPVNFINGLSQSGVDYCLTLDGGDNVPVKLQVCDDSNDHQKWVFDPSLTSGPIQSYFDYDLCLNGGGVETDVTALLSSTCNGTALSQKWFQDNNGISDGLFGKFMSIENGCANTDHNGANVLLQSDLEVSSANWIKKGSTIHGVNSWDYFGYSVDLSSDGSTVAIGSRYGGFGHRRGDVRVFKYNEAANPKWQQLGNGIVGEKDEDEFGHRLSLSSDGRTIVISSNVGYVRVFKYNEGLTSPSWEVMGPKIETVNPSHAPSVSISGDGSTVAIGVGQRNSDIEGYGYIEVYEYDEGSLPPSWELLVPFIGTETEILASDVKLSLDGSTVLVGGNIYSDGVFVETYLKVFKNNNTLSWMQLESGFEDVYTTLKAISADGSIVAHKYRDDNLNQFVRVSGYNEATSSWEQLGSDFGMSPTHIYSLSLSSDGHTLACSMAEYLDSSGDRIGMVEIYKYNAATNKWNQVDSVHGERSMYIGDFMELSSDGSTVVSGNRYAYTQRGIAMIFKNQPTSCTEHQQWNVSTTSVSQSASSGMLNVTISRTGNITVSEGLTSTEKKIGIDYLTSTNRGATTFNAATFEKDCKTPVNETLPVRTIMESHKLLKVEIDFDFAVVENNLKIWKKITNDAGEETGGDFGFCIRVNMVHVATDHELNFHEANLTGKVDKTVGAGFNLVVGVDRDDATEETVDNVNFDATVIGTKCDVSTFTSNTNPVSQGSVLGLCVRSNTTGIKVAGWDSLAITRNSTTFNAIENGIHIPVLVAPSCVDDKCTSQVQLVSAFFDSDGELSVTGKVILAVNDTRRHLVEGKRDIPRIPDESFGRVLDQNVEDPRAEFKLGIDVVSSVSASTTLYPGSFYPFVVAFMALKFLIR